MTAKCVELVVWAIYHVKQAGVIRIDWEMYYD